ncbi:uncharacterized protein A4U43_C10F6110 [Asparagus officinalis]|uniref:NAC domain-containing protein n=1 Tax=Asparagus officinalis TaxID=4686 RepID=A0A5P1E138_ASPOF|nr:NAC domain-containing protein 76-like [Asparagus officinalis]ONK56284.1 uncharacterized protein A4U43_C10F6110 [Asparagus officinalis]
MDSMESCVPPGFRFHPTDEELVGYYLRKKVASQKIDLDVIRDIDLYRIEPWDLQERCRIGYEEQTEWYFFSHKDKKYPTGTRTNRATLAGFWKATGRDKAVHDKNKLIGMRKTLVFYKGRAPNGQKTDWIMHEYRLESEEDAPPQEEGWVVCRAFKKKATSQPKPLIVDPWDSPTYIFNQSSQRFNCSYMQQQFHQPHNNLFLKQENELPQLESPSLLLEEDREQVRVTDWRALDKFVASQLSHEGSHEIERVAGFGADSESDIAAMLSSDGICVFEN